jgi:abhydrolase domain-containing protein 2
VSFDIYGQEKIDSKRILICCPGVGNSSDNTYVQRTCAWALHKKMMFVAQNHLGVNEDVLTAPRIFSLGSTADFHNVVVEVARLFPQSKLVLLGYSLGANLVAKYLGQVGRGRPAAIVGGVSAGQGFDAERLNSLMQDFSNGRRIYSMLICADVKSILRRHRSVIMTKEFLEAHGIEKRDVWSAETMEELAEAYSRRSDMIDSLKSIYDTSSSSAFFDGVDVRLLFINSLDDPIMDHSLVEVAQKAVEKNPLLGLLTTKFGGHLGYAEGGLVEPNRFTWFDWATVEHANVLFELAETASSSNAVAMGKSSDESGKAKKGWCSLPVTHWVVCMWLCKELQP